MVVVREFFAAADVSVGIDENASFSFPDEAIRVAGMIDPSGLVSIHRRIDHPFTVADGKEVDAGIVEIFRNAGPSDSAAGVFDNALAFAKWFRRENAAAVDG